MRYDPEIALYHTPNRAYDPVDGRWMQLDPIGIEDGLNRYAYVRNSPLMGVDPTGLKCQSANGTTTCTPEDKEFEIFSFETPDGWQDFDASSENFYVYRYENDAGTGDQNYGAALPE